MKKTLITGLVTTLLLTGCNNNETPKKETTSPTVKIQEDDPRWNCASMGDHVCGPPWVFWDEYDGHPGCWALLGDTTEIVCADGTKTTS